MSFQQGLSGLNGAQRSLDAISNNVANGSTVGYKLSQAQFSDVFAASLAGGGGSQIGIGTSISNVAQQFSQGNISVTNNPLDVAINGQGFYRMSNNGAVSFSRNGQFQIDKNGFIVNSEGLRLTGFSANASGTIVPASPQDIFIDTADLTPKITSNVEVGLNLDSREAAFGATPALNISDPNTYNASTSVTVYDSLGVGQIMTMYFRKTSANAWDVNYYLTGPRLTTPQSMGTSALAFDTSGAVASGGVVSAASLTPVDPGTGANNLNFSLDFSTSTQFGSTFGVNRMTQDGYTSGRLSGVSIAADGVVQGRYSNGQSRNLGQIVLANFNNPNGLLSLGGNQWAETSDSGPPLVGAPNTGSLGVLQSAAVEESNVDLTAELVNMITQQRNYQANAQSIRTQDQLLQTLVNLR